MRAMECQECGGRIYHPSDIEEFNKYSQLQKQNFQVKLRRVGNSYTVSIPKELINFFEDAIEENQKYRKNSTGKFRCIHQEFVAGDDVQFENLKGDSIEAPEHNYQPFNMTLVSKDEIIKRLSDVLTSIDVGGE